MSPRPTEPGPTLRRYLLGWTVGAALVIWLTLIAVAWSTSLRESRKFTDGQLVAVAQLWMAAAPARPLPQAHPVGHAHDHEYAHDIAVLAWDGDVLTSDSHQMATRLDLKALPVRGLATVPLRQLDGQVQDWRAYSTLRDEGGRARRVVALVDLQQRYEFAQDIAEHVAEPALLLFPLVALALWLAVRRGLRPLDRLSSEVAALDGFAGERLESAHRFREFSSTVSAINALVDTLQLRAQRERGFASDVAHELRTPLTSIALQARALQGEATPQRLAQLEQEALRAGRILGQLLDLARAQRGAGAPAPWVDLEALAAQQLSDHAQQAHESGHELSLVPSAPDLRVRAQPLLLELALRNLLDNALRHTPRGTQVRVNLWQDASATGLSVSDDGQRAGAPTAPRTGGGLGLGLRLVERLAEEMGAELQRDSGDPPQGTRFTLRWPRP